MKKLYYESAYIREFTGTVVRCEKGKKGYEVVLDQTAFYPEGGGQPADHGRLGDVLVTDVHEKNGEVVHYTDGPLKEGDAVHGEIDWDRRFTHMQEHSGEHLVSGLIHGKFGYDNVGFHMGSEEVTIDFNGLLEWEDLMELESRANGMIWENLEIYADFPPKEELDALEYRSKKELSGDIRIVKIPGGDICACCGTHVKRTGEIGLVKFTSLMHYKGGVRITLQCGKGAVLDYERKREQIQKISVLLSAKPDSVAAAVEKMKEENGELQARLSDMGKKLVELRVQEQKAAEGRLGIFEGQLNAVQLRHFANRLLEEKKGNTVLTFSEAANGGFSYVLGSAEEDMRLLSKELNGCLAGRGGGSSQMAQGTFFASKEEIFAVLKEKGFTAAGEA